MAAIVTTRSGKLEGAEESGLCVFRGIPYARPPLGALRFRAPEPAESWQGTRPALKFSPGAPQHTSPLIQIKEQSEDCLYLNVWTPGLDTKKRPVMVWIHGGGFSSGSGGEVIYDGASLAKNHDVVVVTINYRLGAIGYLYLNDIYGGDANRGVRDQVAAFEWVQENIDAFGGDPENVTVFGESAGAMSIGVLLGTPSANGLFKRAVLQSGAAHHTVETANASEVTEIFFKDAGVSNREQLEALSAERILKAQLAAQAVPLNLYERPRRMPSFGMSLVPVIDGDVLPRDPLDAIAAGSAKDVDILIGTNEDEWQLWIQFTDRGKQTLNEEGLLKVCNKRTRDHGARIVPAYLKSREARGLRCKPVDIFNAVETDRVFRIPATRLLEAQLAHRKNAYSYFFTWDSPLFNGELGACHALEIPFSFGNVHTPFAKNFAGTGEAVEQLSKKMERAWANFARSGDPAHEGLPQWPAYDTAHRASMELGKECRILEDQAPEERRIWDELRGHGGGGGTGGGGGGGGGKH